MKEISLNNRVKVKLTPLGAEIFYHRNDEVRKRASIVVQKALCARMPQIDKDGFTEFRLWELMELYGEHIGIARPDVFIDNMIYLAED